MADNEKKTGFAAEFKEFIQRGNVMDMAVGVIIGAAFKAIVDSLVNDILMPLVGIFIGKDSFASLNFKVAGAVINFGSFISAIVNFVIMALIIFLIVRSFNRLHDKKKQEEEPKEEPKPSREEELLTEIRDALREK